jgi:hypothetical protein
MNQNNYLWQVCELVSFSVHSDAVRSGPIAIEPPSGYQLHNWQPNPYSMNTIIVCWITKDQSSSALSHLSPMVTAPVMDAIKRWILKNYAG